MFDGVYGINFSDSILTTSGLKLTPFYIQMKFVDEVPPRVLQTVLDDTGMINTIPFSEAINFNNFNVSNARLLPSGNATTADAATISFLNNKLNYIISPDKKSVSINLSQISPSDYGKMFTITISGVEDLSGNRPENYTLTTIVFTDTSYKNQARPLTAARTAYNRLTVTFDRSISSPGMAKVNSGLLMNGVVDSQDPKKVHFTLYDSDQALSGIQTVYVAYWDSYNVNPADRTADQWVAINNVHFTTEKTLPFLANYEFDAATNILTLTYTEEVTTAFASGVFTYRLQTTSDEIRSGTITYTKMDSADKKQIKLLLGNMTLTGEYRFTLEQGFAIDNFRNMSAASQVVISNATGSLSQLPPPYLITQNASNPSQIYLEFANMLDVASALNLSNYSIAGVQIISVDVIKNQRDGGATVMLTVADGSIDVTVERPVTIKGLMGYGGVLSPMDPYTAYVELKDNKKPYYTGQNAYDKNTGTIRLIFSEEITGTMVVRVSLIHSELSYPIEYANTVSVSGNAVNIQLVGLPQSNSYLRIDILSNSITDLSGNQCQAMHDQLGVATGN
jgi:FlaG/FlaF family flagellin (archaellin)